MAGILDTFRAMFSDSAARGAPSALAHLQDGALTNFLTGRGTTADRSTHNFWLASNMTPQQIDAAYRTSWLIKQVVDIPAYDETRAGRDWDADEEQISKIEAEEKRLALWRKVRQARIYGRLGGGALFINITGQDPASPLPANIRPGSIASLVPLHRTQITIGQMIDDVLDPLFGEPAEFKLNTQAQPTIHASRLVIFHGQSVSGLSTATWEDQFWGDSVVQTVNQAVQDATTATSGFASMVDEAKVDIITMPGMYELLAQPGGRQKFMEALDAAAQGKSLHRMLALGPGETWETRQLSFAGAKDMIVTLMGLAAGAGNIPATKLLGKSPDGMNATGEGDEKNYKDAISASQESELRPALEQLDAVVLPSAGVPSDLSWKFSPLQHLSEKDEADIEAKEAESVSKYATSGLIPESALSKAVQGRLIESGRWPGLKEAIEEAEAAGEELPGDESELGIVPVGGKEADPVSPTTRAPSVSPEPARAANDGKPEVTE